MKWSLYPMGGSVVRIPRQIPYTVACDLLLTGRHISAQEALDLGLIGYVVDDGDALDKAIEIGEIICENGPLSVQAILRTLRETNGMRLEEALEHEFTYGWDVFASQDAKEGPWAFKEKRKPNFQGKWPRRTVDRRPADRQLDRTTAPASARGASVDGPGGGRRRAPVSRSRDDRADGQRARTASDARRRNPDHVRVDTVDSSG